MLKEAKTIINLEAEALKRLSKSLNENFKKAVDIILNCKGRVVVMGMGKSGHIGRKISATLSSTGTSSFFLHPAECRHGDAGMLVSGDVALILSYSGETEEIKKIMPFLKEMHIKIISFTGRPRSKIAKISDVSIDINVRKEACPFNLAPTTSTTVMLALGDALSIVLLKRKGFKKEDFAKFHPGGVLGKRLSLKVADIMRTGDSNPLIRENKSVKDALFVMTKTRLGAVNVINKKGKLLGFFTDGDLRRKISRDNKILSKKIKEVMTKNPTVIYKDDLAIKAAKLIYIRKFDNIPVVDNNGKAIGIVDERDLLKEGII